MISPRSWASGLVVVALLAASGAELRAEDTAAVRAVVEKSGGLLRLDAQGNPVEIDFTAGRGSADADVLTAILACPTVQILRMRVGAMPLRELVKIGSLVKLRELMLQDAAIDDAGLQALVEPLHGLRRLTLRNVAKVSDRGVEAVIRRAPLTHVALIELPISDGALPAAAAAPQLVSLDVRQCPRITSQGLRSLKKSAVLRELKISGQGMDDEALAAVAAIPRLESVSIEDAPISAAGLARLVDSPGVTGRLRHLALVRCQALRDADLQPLGRLTNLTHLTIRDMPVTGAFLRSLQAPEKLDSLSLNETYLNAEAFTTIATCRQLKRLELAQSLLAPEAVRTIGALANLEYLNLSECGLNDESLALLAPLRKLKTLLIDGNPDVSPEALAKLRVSK